MCGIYGISSKDRSYGIVLDAISKVSELAKDERKGDDSYGLVFKQDKANNGFEIVRVRGLGFINKDKVLSKAHKQLTRTGLAIGHTRARTEGGITIPNCHPFISEDWSIAVVHNGNINNWKDIKKELEKKGHKFNGDVDSEIIVHLFEESWNKSYDYNDVKEAVVKVALKLRGWYNLIFMLPKGNILVAYSDGGIYYKVKDGKVKVANANLDSEHLSEVVVKDGLATYSKDSMEPLKTGYMLFVRDGEILKNEQVTVDKYESKLNQWESSWHNRPRQWFGWWDKHNRRNWEEYPDTQTFKEKTCESCKEAESDLNDIEVLPCVECKANLCEDCMKDHKHTFDNELSNCVYIDNNRKYKNIQQHRVRKGKMIKCISCGEYRCKEHHYNARYHGCIITGEKKRDLADIITEAEGCGYYDGI